MPPPVARRAKPKPENSMKNCTCYIGQCRGPAGLGEDWRCVINDITKEDVDNLKHMLGIQDGNRRTWGRRNYFAPRAEDISSMRRLEKAGLVSSGKAYGDTGFFLLPRD
jgi:hypothetical protein